MPLLSFTPNLARQTRVEAREVGGRTVREALEDFFAEFPQARSYLLDDQGEVRQHVAIFVDGKTLADRSGLSDPIGGDSEIFVMQALSGG